MPTQSEGLPQLNSRPPPRKGKKKNKAGQISKDMIHRSERPVRVNQMNAGGWLREEQEDVKPNLIVAGPTIEEPESILLDESPFHEDAVSNADRKKYVVSLPRRLRSLIVPQFQIDSRRH